MTKDRASTSLLFEQDIGEVVDRVLGKLQPIGVGMASPGGFADRGHNTLACHGINAFAFECRFALDIRRGRAAGEARA